MQRPNLPLTDELDGRHPGETIVIVGCARHVKDMDLRPLERFTTIGCNRLLLHPYFRPNYLMVADRRPYHKEMEAGRYKQWSDRITMMFSTSMYDPIIKCHGAPIETPPTDFKWLPWRVRGSSSAMNWSTLGESVNSFASIAGPMLQAAVIMGAKRVAMVGIGIVPGPVKHLYDEREAWTGAGSPPTTLRCFERAKTELDKMGIPVHVCSPEDNLTESVRRLQKAYGHCTYEDFLRQHGDEAVRADQPAEGGTR
ncbi:hypothetical protein LCGC14_3076150 [marine sediment metagenome]|uniref:Uncharacterized protein n=1 Tax=marine sediment metagenome TaxID=412755 RepID=A0A0F8WFC0_9ZZZZ